MREMLLAAALTGVLSACEEPNACDAYVDHMCNCHGDDPDFSCADLQAAFAEASPEVQDQCTIDLEDQQDADDATGAVCTPS